MNQQKYQEVNNKQEIMIQPQGAEKIIFETQQEEKKENNDKLIKFCFFLFVNTKSGGNRAGELINLEAEKIQFILDNQTEQGGIVKKYEANIYFYDLFNKESRERGFENLKLEQLNKRNSSVRVVVCGGDGTVMWVVQEMLKHNCDISISPIGIVAFGTGNDFSRVLGWGGDAPKDIIGQNLMGLKKLVKKWINALIEEFDIWDIKVYTYEDGCFKRIVKQNNQIVKNIIYDVDDRGKQVLDMNGKAIQIKVFKKQMSNYMSIGVDARIGLGFDRHRTTSALGNKCVYCWEGFKKMFLSTLKMNQVIDSLEIMHQQDASEIDINIEDVTQKKTVLFTTKSAANVQKSQQKGQAQQQEEEIKGQQQSDQKKKNQQQEEIITNDALKNLKGNPVCLICLNINSYSGGASDMWLSARGKVGLEETRKKKVSDHFDRQSFGDGKLEFISFSSISALGNERFINGQGLRVAQGKGPFILKFRKEVNNGTAVRTYFQIDGEYCQVISPKCIKIQPCKSLPNGKIKVMVESTSRNSGK